MDTQNEMQRKHIPGLSVCSFSQEGLKLQNFGVLQAGTNREVQDDTLFHACSISKFIAALCVLKLVSEQVLDLNEDINRYLTGWKLKAVHSVGSRQVTLKMLLSHRGGIVDPPDSFGTYRADEKPVSNRHLLEGKTRFQSGPVTVSLLPESGFSYSDAGFCVIEQAVRDVTGKTIPQHAQKYVFEPLNLRSAFFWQKGEEKSCSLERCAAGHNSDGTVIAGTWPCYPNPEGAGLWITASELAAIASDFTRCYNGKGAVLPQAQAKAMVEMGLGIFPVENSTRFTSQGWGEGMQCQLMADYKHGRGIVVMMNQEPGVEQSRSIIGSIIRAFI